MERERGVVEQPPAKRMKLAVSSAGVAVGGGEVASPRSRRLRQTLLVVLFLVRARTTVTASISQIGRMLRRYVDHAFHKYHGMISGKLDSFQEQIEGLRGEVTELSRLCSSRQTDQQTRLEANQEHVSASGLKANTRLCFLNGLKPPVYTDENVTSENDAAIKLAMFEGDKMVTSGPLSEVKVEILVLKDFSNKCRDNWTEEEFDKHIVQGRNGHDLLLGTAWLTNGEVELSQIRFREGSCRKKVIMAARVCKSEKTSGRVQEAIMKPVTVLDRRNKPNEKRHPPRLDDDLFRLEEIGKDGVHHKRLQDVKINKVEGFLKALNEDSDKLRKILKMEKQQNSWSRLTKHARECVFEDKQELKRYQSGDGNVVLFFDCVHNLIGAAFPLEYVACQRFDRTQKALANKWKRHAYGELEGISPDFIMKGNIPEPISSSTDVAVAPSILSMGASQSIFSANQLAQYQGTRATQNLAYDEHVMGPIYPSTSCDPIIPEGLNTQFYQGTGTAEKLPQEEHVLGPVASCGPTITDPNDQGIPLHDQQQTVSPWPQSPQSLMDFYYQTELASMYQDSSGASTSAQPYFGPHDLPQSHQTASIAEHEGPGCPGFSGPDHANDFQ
ncbi:unnamed protein product [Urochloa humidicola]